MKTDTLVLPAPAKLNLFLRITGRRPDGYHDLQTVFQLLDWGDDVSLTRLEDGSIRRGADIEGVAVDDDLSLRAATALGEAARSADRPFGGAEVTVHKRIPQGSGLGGSSTDAATVLLGLNHLWGCGFSLGQLAEIGLQLGADVPVFVRGRSAWAEGIGDDLEPVALGERWYVLVFPRVHAATACLFADPELERNSPALPRELRGDLCAHGNAFLPVLKKREPAVAEAVERLSAYGAPRLSGSGSTLYLEAVDEAEAHRLTTALKNHYNVRAVRGLDESPLHAALAFAGR
ncbi:MAG: 4-(cytidine 5'-diphospho)-2-C-methyl-D-erythritol kinase [Xanthomonadales bacterium]|jgi:4-diphosphocytidyl-2-C-methyl-D-erythritol kinase|nr:4-(cytidine 5'-diphospho)-2-C-methyl-D-erythritol kinase [Xanthomonadales bacterium]